MRKILICFVSLFLVIGSYAQQTAAMGKPIQVAFGYDEAGLRKAIKENKVVLILSNLPDGPSLEQFDKSLGNYKTFYTMAVGRLNAKGERDCQLIFKGTDYKFGILNRLFEANGIHELMFNGKVEKAEAFFARFTN